MKGIDKMKCRLFLTLVATFLVFSATFALGSGIVYASGMSGGAGNGQPDRIANDPGPGNGQLGEIANALSSDPYTSGCSKGAYLAISGPIKDAGKYSGNCRKLVLSELCEELGTHCVE
jgi:hypothetical protein